jgi:cytochrome P450
VNQRLPSAASPSLEVLTGDPHETLATIRSRGPIGWVDALGGWMVVGYPLAVEVMRDANTFTVDDPRFSTSRVVGSSMLSTDGAQHARHRQPFVAPFTPPSVREHFHEFVHGEATRLVAKVAPHHEAELRTTVAGPLATACMRRALGLEDIPVDRLLRWYASIVRAVADVTAGAPVPDTGKAAYSALTAAVRATISASDGNSFLGQVITSAAGVLTTPEILSDTAVLLFGGIETTEGMIANLLYHLLRDPSALAAVRADGARLDAAIEESLRLEPAAAVVDRYATREVEIGGVHIRKDDLVVVSLAGANRDSEVFADPDVFDPSRPNVRRHLAFAQGPHVCLGMHLARLETQAATRAVLDLPGLQLDRARSVAPSGLVFRKPPAVWARWSA